jgi:hypothetical protein
MLFEIDRDAKTVAVVLWSYAALGHAKDPTNNHIHRLTDVRQFGSTRHVRLIVP